ncbi:MAG TPA: SMC-Scp complex subunit ScpB [Anaerolineales bacterium]|nr:SMC-Scp complex subunit ScpB [Anaerolineales bacterium]
MSESENFPTLDIPAALEALLFVSPEPVAPAQLAAALDLSVSAVEQGLKQLDGELQARGLRLQRHAGRVQLTTAPEMAEAIERFLGLEATSRLSRAALETLAIIAYQQPVTRPYIEGVRGVSSDGVMKSLLSKGLVQEIGRAEGPGRPILYGTAPDFLQHFGLNSLTELPPLTLPEPEAGNGNGNGHDEMLKG